MAVHPAIIVREPAFKHNLTWDAAAEMSMCFCIEKPSNGAIMKLGIRMSSPAQLKSRAEAEGSTNPVELTPRSAATEKVTSAIKLKDGRVMPIGDKAVPLPPPPGNLGAIKAPPGNFFVGQQSPPPQASINHGGVQFPIDRCKEEEEEEVQTTRSAPGVSTWWTAEDIKKYLQNETPGAVVWKHAMERLHLRQHHRLRQLAPRRGLHARSALQMASAKHDLRDGARAGDPPLTAGLPREHQERQPMPEGVPAEQSCLAW